MAGVRGVRKSPTVTPPQFKESLPDISVFTLGKSVYLECHVDGYPRPEVRWEKDGKAVMKSRNIHMMRSGDRCMLQIKNLQEKDLGRYECMAINMIGTANSKSQVRSSDSIASTPTDGKISADNKMSNPLKVQKKVLPRSRSSERKSGKNFPNSWRSSSVSANSANPKLREEFRQDSTIFERLSRATKVHENNFEKTPKLPNNCRNGENIDIKQSLANRLIAKIKIPNIFKQVNNSTMKIETQHHVVNNHHTSRIPQEKKSSSPASIRRCNGITQLQKQEMNGLAHIGRKSIKDNWTKFTQKKEVPQEKQIPQVVQKKDNILDHRKKHQLPHSRTNNGTCHKHIPSFDQITNNDSYNSLDDSRSKPHAPSIESFVDGVKSDDPEHVVAEDHVCSVTKLPTSKVKDDNNVLIHVTEATSYIRKTDPNMVRITSSLDTIHNIAETMLMDIGVLPNVSTKFVKDCSKTAVDYVPTSSHGSTSVNNTLDTAVDTITDKATRNSDSSSSDAPVPELLTRSPPVASGSDIQKRKNQQNEDSKLNGGSNWPSQTIPRICIQSSKDEFLNEPQCGDIFAKELNESPLFSDGRKCCAGNIRYLTPAIEEECEDLTSPSMTPITEAVVGNLAEVDRYLARRGQGDDSEFQKVTLLDETPARIARGPQSVTVLRGESVTLAIHFAGVPTPDVIWIKGGSTLADGGRNSILVGKDMSVLTVSSVTADDSGKYVVCVENEGGGDSCFASVAVVGFPEPPGGEPTASDFTDHSLVLSWYGSMYDGGSVVTGYVVEMCLASDRKWQRVASCENTSYVVQGLSCGQRYIFRVRAENKYGVSHPSRVSQTICLDDYLSDKLLVSDEINELRSDPVSIQVGSQFSEQFEMKEEVGKGRFGTVYRCIEIVTGRPRAAKVIRCIKVKDKEKVRQEVDIMNQLHHPKLLKILGAFESGRNMIMITEYISGGELFERVIADDFILTESDCVIFMRQICDGVAYMHNNLIIHLDLKPENILCRTRTSHQIKIIDFGLARLYDEKENLRILFGTPEFVAPEVISYEPVGPASDMWSIGVICYVLLSGLSPFMGDTDSETFANITIGEIDFDEEAFLTISQDAKTFISSLLIKKPNKRTSAEQCLKHTWLERATSWVQSRDHPISTAKLKKFIIRRKWQKSGTAIRALGRMVSLSRSSAGSSCESTSPSASPTTSRSRSLISSRSETNESGDSEVFRDTDSVDLSR